MEPWQKEWQKVRRWLADLDNGLNIARKANVKKESAYGIVNDSRDIYTSNFLKILLAYGGQVLTSDERPVALPPPVPQVSSHSSRVTRKVVETLNREGASLREGSSLGEILDESLRRGRDITAIIDRACAEVYREEKMQNYVKEDVHDHVAENGKTYKTGRASG